MKKKLLKFISIISLAVFFPVVSFAATAGGLLDVISKMKDILGAILPVLISIGVVYFIWGVIMYVIADGEEAKKKGKDRMIYGIIGFAVIIGLWGLVNIIAVTFGINNATAPNLAPITGTTTGTSANCSGITSSSKFQDVLCYFTTILNNSIIPLIFAIATVMFIWGAINFFIINADEEAKRAQGRQYMIWGIVALTVMLSVWGLVGILARTLNIQGGGSVLPQVHPPQN